MKYLLTLSLLHFFTAISYGALTDSQCEKYINDNVNLAKAQIQTPVSCNAFKGLDFKELNHHLCDDVNSKTTLAGKVMRAYDEISSKIFLLELSASEKQGLNDIYEISLLSEVGLTEVNLKSKIERECAKEKPKYSICQKSEKNQTLINDVYKADDLINTPSVSLIDHGENDRTKTNLFYKFLSSPEDKKNKIKELKAKLEVLRKTLNATVEKNKSIEHIQEAKMYVAHIVSNQCIQREHLKTEKITCDDFKQAKKLDNESLTSNLSVVDNIGSVAQANQLCSKLDAHIQSIISFCHSSNGNEVYRPEGDQEIANSEENQGPSTLERLKERQILNAKKSVRKEYYDNLEENMDKVSYVANWKKNSGWRPEAGKAHLYHKKIVGYTSTGLAINQYSKRTPWKYVAIEAFKGFAKFAPTLIQNEITKDAFAANVDRQVEAARIRQRAWACYSPNNFYAEDGSFDADLFEANCLNGNSAFFPNFSFPTAANTTSSTLTSPFGLGLNPSTITTGTNNIFQSNLQLTNPSLLGTGSAVTGFNL